MKNNYEQEFDLKLIYEKLTAPLPVITVNASEFFSKPKYCSLQEIQKNLAKLDRIRSKVK